MTFSIQFLAVPEEYLGDDPTTPFAIGEIRLGDFREEFASSLYTWSRRDYESQWSLALHHILHGQGKAALMTEYISPEESGRLHWWLMYREEQKVFFQDHLLFFENGPKELQRLTVPFNIERQFNFVRDRRTVNEDGDSISEWSVGIDDIEAFAATLKQT